MTIKRFAVVFFSALVAAVPAYAQNQPTSLQVTRIYNITSSWPGDCGSGGLDNRSQFLRQNNYHSFIAYGSGNWSVQMQWSDTSCTGPWTSYGSAALISQASNPPIGYGDDGPTYHQFISFVITGNPTINYSAAKDFFLSTSVGSIVFPLSVAQGGTGLGTLTLNGIPYGQGTSALAVTAAGSQYQVFQAGASGVPAFGPVQLAQSAAVTGVLPKANETMPAWADITGTKQGNTNIPQMAGTNSGTAGAALCNDASGNATTSGCAAAIPSISSPLTYLRTTPNVAGNPMQWSRLPLVSAPDYNFPAQTIGGAISSGFTITANLSPCPLGVAGADVGHYLYLSGGTGTAEAVLITGGTCTSGAASGTVTFVPANNHSGSWTLASTNGGISEAICSLPSGGGDVVVPSGSYTLNSTLNTVAVANAFCGKSTVRMLIQQGVTFAGSGTLPTPNGTNQVYYAGVNFAGKAGTVTIYPPYIANVAAGTSAGPVVAPDGSLVSTNGTVTSGLAEAFTYAAAHGYNIHIVGGDELKSINGINNCSNQTGMGLTCNQVVYTLAATWTWPAFQGMSISSGSVIFGWFAAQIGTNDCMVVNTMEMVKVDLAGAQIECGGTGASRGLVFKPINAEPLDNGITIVDSFFHITTAGAAGTAAVAWDTSNGSITNTFFQVDEVNGGNGNYCMLVSPSPGANVQFAGNKIFSNHVHGCTTTAIAVGNGVPVGTLKGNYWNVFVSTEHTTARGIDTYGQGDIWDVPGIDGTSGASAIHILFENSADNNIMRVGEIGTGPYQFQGCSSNNCPSSAHSIVQYQHTQAVTSQTVGGSPWTYQNLSYQKQKFCVTGGTVSAIALSPDNVTYITTGQTSGCWSMDPGDFAKVTYSVLPTVQTVN